MGKSVAVRVPVGAPPAGAARTYVGHELVGRVVLGLLRLHDVAVGDVDVEPREVLHRLLPAGKRTVSTRRYSQRYSQRYSRKH